MKPLRFLLCAVLISLPRIAFAQSDAERSFAALKNLAGTWSGPVSTTPAVPMPAGTEIMRNTMRVTSRGNALVHEMVFAKLPDDPIKYDHPVTMIHLNDGQLMLTHYCDAGNRPRMVGRVSADGKTIDFDFVDITGSTKRGHMSHVRFTFIDADRHTQEWTYQPPTGEPIVARMEYRREPVTSASAAR